MGDTVGIGWETYAQRMINRGAVNVDDLESNFLKSANDPNSVVSFLNAGLDDAVNKIVSGITSGTDQGFAESKQTYDDLNETITNNTDAFNSVLRYPGGSRSRSVLSYQERASKALSRDFNNREVQLPDGTRVTVGQFFQNPGQFTRSFSHKDFAPESYQAYMSGEDPTLTRMLAPFMEQEFKSSAGKGMNPYHDQDTRGALAITQHADQIRDAFTDSGAEYFCSRLRADLADVGAYDKFIPILCDYAKRKAAVDGYSGSHLAAKVTSDFHTMFTKAAVSAAGPDGAGKLTPESKAIVASTVLEAMHKMSETGQFYDLSDPTKTQALIECTSADARAKAAGYNDAFDYSGVGSVFGTHVANAGTSDRTQGLMAMWSGTGNTPGFLDMSHSLITGGETFVPDKPNRSSNIAQWGLVRSLAGGVSSSPTLDAMVTQMVDKICYEEYLPGMKEGRTPEEIRNDLSVDTQGGERILAGLESLVSTYGVTDPRAKRMIADAVFSSHVTKQPFNMQSWLSRVAFTNDPGDAVDPAIADLRRLYTATVYAPKQHEADYNAALANLMSADGYGLPEAEARRLLAQIDSEVTGILSSSKDGEYVNPREQYQRIANSGRFYHMEKRKNDAGQDVIGWVTDFADYDDVIKNYYPELAKLPTNVARLRFRRENAERKTQHAAHLAAIRQQQNVFNASMAREEAKRQNKMLDTADDGNY